MESKILVVDDDVKLQGLLKEYLEGYGFVVDSLYDGLNVTEKVLSQKPDLVVLDIMMPGKNGLDVLADLRTESKTPVIMLTAKGEDADRIVGLELGADDYLPKPFNPRELLARIRAVMRRGRNGLEDPGRDSGKTMIRAGGLGLDQAKRALRVEGREIELSATEFRIMEALMRRPETVFTRDQLLSLARGRDFMAFDRSVDVHISNLRAKLKPFPRFRKVIKTVWGTGYLLQEIS